MDDIPSYSYMRSVLTARGGGGGVVVEERGGGGVTSYIWHGTDVHAEWPSFSALQGI